MRRGSLRVKRLQTVAPRDATGYGLKPDSAHTRFMTTYRSHPEIRKAASLRVAHPDAPATVSHICDPPLDGWVRLTSVFPPQGLVEAVVELVYLDGGRAARILPRSDRNRFDLLLRLPAPVVALHLHLAGSARLEGAALRVRPANALAAMTRLTVRSLREGGRAGLRNAARLAFRIARGDIVTVPLRPRRFPDRETAWRHLLDERPHEHRARHAERAAALGDTPLVSILAFPADQADAEAMAADARDQIHSRWELIVRGPQPLGPDARIRDETAAAEGAYILPLPPGVRLRPHALLDLVATVRAAPSARLIFADEAIGTGHDDLVPLFKPDWSPIAGTARDLVGAPILFEAAALEAVGGVRPGPAAAAIADAMFRVAESVGDAGIRHLSKVLAYRAEACPIGIEDWEAIASARTARRGLPVHVTRDQTNDRVRLVPDAARPQSVSIIVPTRDRADLLRLSIGSVIALTDYPDYEILVVDNGSVEDETTHLFASWSSERRIRVIPAPGPFNYSRLNNAAVGEARGDIVVLFNNDVQVLDAGWLRELAGWAAMPGIGCVGAKLLYPDGTIQHAGVTPGVGHVFKRSPGGSAGPSGRLVSLTEAGAVTAACLAVRRSVYEEAGGLDEEDFAVGFNDVDFCLKVAAAGYRNLWTPHAVLAHHESVSRGKEITPARTRRFGREIRALDKRWLFSLTMDPFHSPHQTREDESGLLRER
jgi:GT2 family glycosyltransferase